MSPPPAATPSRARAREAPAARLVGPALLVATVATTAALVLVVDSSAPATTVPLAAAAMALVAGVAWWERRRPSLHAAHLVAGVVALCAVAVARPPRGSTDLWSYAMYGRMLWHFGLNPYIRLPAELLGDPILRHVAPGWWGAASVYGPGFTGLSAVLSPLAGTSALVTRLLYQGMAAACVVAIAALLLRARAPRWAVAVAVLNPLVYVYVVNQGHNDALVALGLTLAAVALARGRVGVAGLAIAAAASVKLVALLAAGGAAVWLWRRARRADTIRFLAAAIAPVAVSYAFVGGRLALDPLLHSDKMISRAAAWGMFDAAFDRPPGVVAVAVVALVAVVLTAFAVHDDSPAPALLAGIAAYLVAGAYVLPWYFVWGLPLVAMARRPKLVGAALAATTLVVLAYEYVPAPSVHGANEVARQVRGVAQLAALGAILGALRLLPAAVRRLLTRPELVDIGGPPTAGQGGTMPAPEPPARPTRRVQRARGVGPLIVALALVAAGCSSGGNDSTDRAASTTSTGAAAGGQGSATAPAGDAFYTPPDPLPAGRAGDVIWSAPLTPAPAGTRAWRILYRSTTVDDRPVAVSGLMLVPDPLPVARPVPILALAHGTTGLADRCAPSRQALDHTEVGNLPAAITSAYVVVATDYQGLGTPGVHPYIVGLSEGRNVLDSIRTAQRFEGAGTSTASKAEIWGHSQGGGASLVAAELAPSYAPDDNVIGAVAGAPAAELRLLATALRSSPAFGYVFMAAAGFRAAYPSLDLSAVFTPAGLAQVDKAGDECGGEAIDDVRGKPPGDYLHADPGTTEPMATLLEQNSPGFRATTVPIFLYHGEADTVIPVVASKLVLDRYCRNGTTASRKTWPGEDHTSVVGAALPDIEAYLAARLEGAPAPKSC